MTFLDNIKNKVEKYYDDKKSKKILEKERENNYKLVIEKEKERIKKLDDSIPDAYISLRSINKIYDNNVQAVYDFNLDINKGEFIVFVGPSGCGKSTTLRMIAGLEDITTGDLFIDGQYSNLLLPKDRDTSMVFQNYALYPHLSVYENMAIGLKVKKIPKAEIDEKIQKAAEILQLKDYLNRKPRALSGGQCQRVALGRAIVKDAKVFLMDEPLSNLDAKLRVQMRIEIISLTKALNATTIYVTHDQVEAMTMADRIVVMNKGVIQQIGTPSEIYNHPKNVFVAGFMGTPAMNLINGVIDNNSIRLGDQINFDLDDAYKIRIHNFYSNLLAQYEAELVNNDEENLQRNEVLAQLEACSPTDFKKRTRFEKKLELIEKNNTRKAFLIDSIAKIKESIASERYDIVFGIRAEDISCDKFENSYTVDAHINVIELLGNEYYLHTKINGTDIIVKAPASKKFVSDEDMTLYINRDKIYIFDKISTNCID